MTTQNISKKHSCNRPVVNNQGDMLRSSDPFMEMATRDTMEGFFGYLKTFKDYHEETIEELMRDFNDYRCAKRSRK